MKIVEVETFVVANPPPRHGGRYFIFVKLTTDNGVSGIGEAYAASFNPHLIAKMIEDTADRFLIGENPFQIETFWRRSYGVGYTCLLYTSPSPRDRTRSRMPSSA